MDVRCSKCATEYEFDDDKVTPMGIAVQCTTCGHVFKVRREQGAIPTPVVVDDTKRDHWVVRDGQGHIHRFRELTTLQKWIVEQKVTREDEISKTGRSWKALGEITELSSFFAVVEAANRARAHKSPAPKVPEENDEAVTETDRVTAFDPGKTGSFAKPVFPSHLQYSEGKYSDATPQVAAPDAARESVGAKVTEAAPKGIATLPKDIAARPSDEEPTERVQRAPKVESEEDYGFDDNIFSEDFGNDVDLSVLDHDDPVLMWKRRTRNRRLLSLFVVLLLLAPVAFFLFARPTFDELTAPLRAWLDVESAPVETPPREVKIDPEVLAKEVLAEQLKAQAQDAKKKVDAGPAPKERGTTSASLSFAKAQESLANAKNFEDSPALAARIYAQQSIVAAEAARLAKTDAQKSQANKDKASASAKAYQAATRARSVDKAGAHLAFGAYYAAQNAPLEMESELGAAVALVPEAELEAQRIRFQRRVLDEKDRSANGSELQQKLLQLQKLSAESDSRLLYAKALLHSPQSREYREAVQSLRGTKMPPPEYANAMALKTPVTPSLSSLDARTLSKRGTALQKRGKTKQAIAHLRLATQKEANDFGAWISLGWAYLDAGRSNKALAAFETVVEKRPNMAGAQIGMAEALRYTGRNAAAVAAYNRYLQLAPEGREATMARNAIKALKP